MGCRRTRPPIHIISTSATRVFRHLTATARNVCSHKATRRQGVRRASAPGYLQGRPALAPEAARAWFAEFVRRRVLLRFGAAQSTNNRRPLLTTIGNSAAAKARTAHTASSGQVCTQYSPVDMSSQLQSSSRQPCNVETARVRGCTLHCFEAAKQLRSKNSSFPLNLSYCILTLLYPNVTRAPPYSTQLVREP